MKTLLIVDIQNDFLPGGSLEVKDGDKIIDPINEIMDDYDHIVATKDWHPADHVSFVDSHIGKKVGDIIKVNGVDQILWPRHCVQDTFGADFPNNLNYEKINKIIYKGTNKDIDSYSGFYDNAKGATTHLSEYLKSKGIDKVDCVGLATEYCVKYTAIDASREGFSTRVKLKYTKGLNQNDINQAIEEMRSNKIVMI